MNLEKINDILNKLSVTPGRIDKENILKSIKDDKETLSVLKFLNDPLIVTNLAYKKMNKNVVNTEVREVGTLQELIDYVSYESTGTDKDVATVLKFIEDNPKYEDMIKKIVTKTFKTGLSAKTLNKIYGKDFIFIMELQLAETYKENDKKKFPDNSLFTITIKFDGHRNVFQPISNKFMTRSGKVNTGLTELTTEATKIMSYLKEKYNQDFYLDGEILIENTDKPKEEWFNETSKLLGAKQDNKTNLKYIIFDICPKNEFEVDKISKLNYTDRRAILVDAFENLELKHIEHAKALYTGTDKNKIMELYLKAIEDGEEGIMINLEAPYYCKRTSTLLKVKPVQSADLEIVGFEEGSPNSKYEGMLGALVVDYKGARVGVGSGLSDELRKEIWENKEDYLGKIAEIVYTTESVNQENSEISLRFPRFKCIRTDKTVDDINFE